MNKTDYGSNLYQTPIKIEEKLQSLFREGQEEIFEDGMDSEFSKNLLSFLNQYKIAGFDALTSIIISENVNPAMAAQALREIGHINDPVSHRQRRWLLEQALTLPSARVRDGAALGLAFMDDPDAIPSLQDAIEREKITMLRDDMIQVLEQL
jgi:HEAT repeats